jgi:hypothetical protein
MPRKRGKKYALKKARLLPEDTSHSIEEYDYMPVKKEKDPWDSVTDALWEKFNNPDNYPLFCYLNKDDLKAFVGESIASLTYFKE